MAYIVRCQPLRSSPGLTKHCSALRALRDSPEEYEISDTVTHEARTSMQARTSGFILGTTTAKIERKTKRKVTKYFIFDSLQQSQLKTTG